MESSPDVVAPESLSDVVARLDEALAADVWAGELGGRAGTVVAAVLPWLRMAAARQELLDAEGRPCGASEPHVMHTWYGAAEVDGAVTMRMQVCKGTPVRAIAVEDASRMRTLRCYGAPGSGCRAVLVFAAEIDWALVGVLGWASVERGGEMPEVMRAVGWDSGVRAAYAGAREQVWLCPAHR